MGKAVITAKVPSVMDYNSDGLIWYKAGDEKDLLKKLEWIFDHPVEIKKLGNINKSTVRNKYSAEQMAEEFEKICLELIKNKEY